MYTSSKSDGLICIRFVGDGLKISNFPLYYKNLNFIVTSTLSGVGERKLKRRRYLIIIMLKQNEGRGITEPYKTCKVFILTRRANDVGQ